MRIDALDVDTEAVEKMVIVENYQGIHEATMPAENAGWSLADDCGGLPTYLQSFNLNPGGLLSRAAPAIPNTRNGNTLTSTEKSTVINYKKLRPSTNNAKKGAFPIVYSYGDIYEPFDMDKYL